MSFTASLSLALLLHRGGDGGLAPVFAVLTLIAIVFGVVKAAAGGSTPEPPVRITSSPKARSSRQKKQHNGPNISFPG